MTEEQMQQICRTIWQEMEHHLLQKVKEEMQNVAYEVTLRILIEKDLIERSEDDDAS